MPATYEALLKFAKAKNYHVHRTKHGSFIGWPLDHSCECAWVAQGIHAAFKLIGIRDKDEFLGALGARRP